MNASGAIARARFRIRDQSSEFFTSDTDLLYIINGTLEELYSTLQFMESILIYEHTTVTTSTGTTASTAEVSLAFSHAGIMENGVWRVGFGDSPLYAVVETEKKYWNVDGATGTAVVAVPSAYYLTQNGGTMGFLHIPDNVYTFNVFYWKPITQLSATTSALPYRGIFDEYITNKLVVECLEVMERDNSRASILAQIAYNKALQKVYALGLRRKKMVSNMFSVEGI